MNIYIYTDTLELVNIFMHIYTYSLMFIYIFTLAPTCMI